MGRGRPRAAGKVYYLGRLRYRPGIDPPELGELLEGMEEAGPARRKEMLRQALIGGIERVVQQGQVIEDEEVRELMDDLLGEF